MKSFYRVLIFVSSSIFTSFPMCFEAVAQESPAAIVADGKIIAASKELGRLIHLKWSGKRLVIDRDHWMKVTRKKSDADKVDDQIASMVKRGIPEAIARRMVDRDRGPRRRPRGFGGADFLTSSSEGQLFTELKAAAGAMSGGGGGGGDEHHWDGRGGGIYTAMSTRDSTRDFRFMISETNDTAQELLVEEHHVKGMRIQFSSPERNLVFVQGTDDVIQVAHTTPTRNEAFRVSSYEEMLEKYPAFASDFGELLDKLGINRPITALDEIVVEAIRNQLVLPDVETLVDAEKAISRLNDPAFRVRDEAQKLVAKNFLPWQSVIRGKLTDTDLDTETRIRLEQVVKNSAPETTEAERFIEVRGLLENVEYLKSIADQIPESLQPALQERISKLEETSPQ